MGKGSVTMKLLKVDIKPQIKALIKTTADNTAKDISDNSPKRNDVYESGWTPTILGDGEAVVSNQGKEKYLTHLLELGHATKNGGAVAPQEHIRPAYLKNKAIFLRELSKIKIEAK